jgi:nicotinamidase-related amidase
MPTSPEPLRKENTALIVIDMQERFRALIADMPQIISACSRLIRFCDRLEIPMVVTEHYPQGLGATLPELRKLFRPFEALEKITFSCAADERFLATVQQLQRNQLILCGIETHVCVYQTARDLMRQNRQIVLAADALSSRTPFDRQTGLAYMRDLGGQVMSVEMIMFEILQKAKTKDFQGVADILKE